MSGFLKAADAAELPPGASLCVELGGERIALFNLGGTVHAIAEACTHRGGPLSDGQIEGTEVVCPWHGARFDLATGSATGPPAPGPVRRYEVRVEEGEIRIALP